MQEIGGQDPGGLSVQELPSGRAVPARRRVDARGAQDLVDRGCRDRDAELGQLAADTPVTSARVLVRRADGKPAMLRTVAGRPGRRRLLVSYFLAASLRFQASSVAGVTGRSRPSAGAG